jgi:hypothetical protein
MMDAKNNVDEIPTDERINEVAMTILITFMRTARKRLP